MPSRRFTLEEIEAHNRKFPTPALKQPQNTPVRPSRSPVVTPEASARVPIPEKAQKDHHEAIYEANPDSQIPHPKPERHKKAALERSNAREKEGLPRITVRFVGYRVRPLDPDNFAGGCKDLLDGLRHAAIIPGDEPWRITLQTEQVCVHAYAQERTVIEINDPGKA